MKFFTSLILGILLVGGNGFVHNKLDLARTEGGSL